MKRTTLLFALIFLFNLAWGQDENLKYSSGSTTGEVNFSPFSNTPVSINSIRGRYFASNNTAYRAGIYLNLRNQNPSPGQTNNAFAIRLEPGIEKHLPGTDRLSPYYGGVFKIGFKTASSEIGPDPDDPRITGAWSQGGAERGYFNLGISAVAGADFFVARHVYLGTEIGFGIMWKNPADIKVKSGNTTNTVSEGGTNMELGPQFNSAIRLGFVF